MRILVLAPRFPYPLDKGDRLTVFNLVRHFSRLHDVALVTFLEPGQDPADRRHLDDAAVRIDTVPLPRWRSYVRAVLGMLRGRPLQVGYYSSSQMRRTVARVIEEFRPDIVYSHTIRMAEYLAGDPRPKVLAMQISMRLNYGRLARFHKSPVRRLVYRVEAWWAGKYEPKIARRFDRCLLISEHDVAALGTPRPANVFINPHGVDSRFFSSTGAGAERDGHLVFTGNMAYPPNADAVEWFVEEILPLVREEVPDARLTVVGADPLPSVLALAADGIIEVTGRVSDLRPYLDGARVAIDPLRVGAGLQNKILEGMSMGLPMVVTSVANEGIGAQPGRDLLVADTPEEFAAAVVTLLHDEAMRTTIGAHARTFIVEKWSWEKHFDDLEREMCSLVAGAGGMTAG
ncbi:MAG: glycosyltransferase [Actinobacteria bacterium]|nr:glycosyltransferase [Actinomycetota bacterium]